MISPSWDPFGDTEFILAGLIQWSTYVAMYIWVYFIQNYDKRIVFQIEKSKKKMSFLYIFTISPFQRPREISQNVSGLYYVRRAAGYKIHICAKLYYLGRAKVFSSVATDFGSWTMLIDKMAATEKPC